MTNVTFRRKSRLRYNRPYMKTSATLPAPYGLNIIESCVTCVMQEEGLFCRLPPEALGELNSIRQGSFYPADAQLFVEGESPRGVFILCSGEARLTATSKDGKSITLRQVAPGEVLGLSSVVAKKPFPVAAQTLSPSQVSFIPAQKFLRFLEKHAEVAMRVAEHLSMELHRAWDQTRLLALAPNARAKFAQLLLVWAGENGKKTSEGVQVQFSMSQEEIGEFIGATRETVSRLLADFKRQGLIRVKGASVLLVKPEELRALGES